jgi:para-nitrobenzyl esterase
VYIYQFGYIPVTSRERLQFGAGHGSDLSFVFNTLNVRMGSTAEATSEEKELTRIMST